MKITICGSVEFSPKIIEIKKELESMNHRVNIPYYTQKIIDGEVSYEDYMKTRERDGGDILLREAIAVDFLKRYWDYIKDSDAILVLNLRKKDIENYIGGNTLIEMGFAYGHEKKIFLFNPIPKRNERMHYVDEIIDMKPIVINGDLSKIE